LTGPRTERGWILTANDHGEEIGQESLQETVREEECFEESTRNELGEDCASEEDDALLAGLRAGSRQEADGQGELQTEGSPDGLGNEGGQPGSCCKQASEAQLTVGYCPILRTWTLSGFADFC
jgi:hypothetical protein